MLFWYVLPIVLFPFLPVLLSLVRTFGGSKLVTGGMAIPDLQSSSRK